MIGFEMIANGSNGFRRKRGAWTEGSLLALKIVMSAPKVNVPGAGGKNRTIIGAIESQFSKLAQIYFERAYSEGQDFTLFVKGDFAFKYVFDYSRPANEIKQDILRLFAAQDEDLGDQVLIHFAQTIYEFQLHNVGNNAEDLILTIDIDL